MDSLNAYKIDLFERGYTIGDNLKYHRLKKNLTQDELANIVDFATGSCIKDIELNRKLIGREVSKKLANYFKLNTKYFYDAYLEDTDKAAEVLKEYRNRNNLTIKEVCNKFNISITAWHSWESSKSYISREKYKILKNNRIL